MLFIFLLFVYWFQRRLLTDESSGEINKVARTNPPVETAGVKTLRDMIAFLYMPPLDKKSNNIYLLVSVLYFVIFKYLKWNLFHWGKKCKLFNMLVKFIFESKFIGCTNNLVMHSKHQKLILDLRKKLKFKDWLINHTFSR